MPKARTTKEDIFEWQRKTEAALEERRMEFRRFIEEVGPTDGLALKRDSKQFAELEAAHDQRDKDFHKKICEMYRRSGSLSELRGTLLYKEIKSFYDVAWAVAKYELNGLAEKPKVKKALAKLAEFIFAPPLRDGFPIHLLPIPRELYQWKPDDLPRAGMIPHKDRQDTVNVERLRKLCDPLAVDLSKRTGEGTARSCADDYIAVLLNKLKISLV